jgi:hypothetical protein
MTFDLTQKRCPLRLFVGDDCSNNELCET